YLLLVDPESKKLWGPILAQLRETLDSRPRPWLIFSQREQVAQAAFESLQEDGEWEAHIITGKTAKKTAEATKRLFIDSKEKKRVLIGTSTLATGADGIDRVCDQLLIIDDIVGDNAKRRQLIGRV